MMIIQLIRDIETFAPTLEIGKIDRGKYTKWMIRMFPANEFVAEFNDFAKGVRYMEFTKAVELSAASGVAVEVNYSA